jgi:hypothetical protein
LVLALELQYRPLFKKWQGFFYYMKKKGNSPLSGCGISPVLWDIFYDKTVIFATIESIVL